MDEENPLIGRFWIYDMNGKPFCAPTKIVSFRVSMNGDTFYLISDTGDIYNFRNISLMTRIEETN